MVQIYSEDNTDYEHNGDAVLDPISCDLHVVLNGSWEVTLESALDEQEKFQTILTNAVLSADTPVSDKQLFRIYDVERADTGVTAYARPIFLDSAREVFLNDCRPTNLTGQEALNYLMQGTPYSGKTDITLTNTAYYVRKNLIEAIAGSEDNSFLSRWGGEISYDNYTINILVQQGEDNGLRVEFGTNIESIKEIIDVDEMATRVVPVAFNGRTLDGDEPWVDSPLIDNYPIIYTKIVEFSDMRLMEDLNEDEDPDDDDNTYYDTLEELQEAMIARVKQLYVEGLDLPSITYEVNMLDLRRADEYEEYKDLETVNLGDTVYCYHRRLGIETQARVIEYNYDCIRKCITSLVIGDFREDYLDHLSDITSSSGGTVDFSQIWDRFDYIEANYIRTNQLEAEIAKFGYLTAAEADITYARITDLTAALAQINEIIADEIYAVYIDVDALDASVANIISLLGGDIATGTLDTIHLTVENAVIDSEVVVSALIDQAIIGDLLAGVIYTDYITIMDNENGNMILAGPTIQFIDSDDNYRMQVGLDEQGNFNIYILDADGNILFDALGLTEAGLIGNGAIIRDVAVADDANISGYKLNIQEVATILNEDGSLIVDAGQVIINGQQLSTVYTEIVTDINTALTDAEKALELAGEVIEIGARNYLLNTRALTQDPLKTLYTGFTLSEDESEFGILTEENGSSQIVMLTAISAEKNSLSGKNMIFSCDMLEDNLTSILEDYELEFGIYSSNDNGETWTKYASLGSSLDDDSVFDINRDDLLDGAWCRLTAKFTASVEHTHTMEGTPTFIWGDDMTCEAVYTCSACGLEIREKCDVTETGTDATCTDDGALTYTATVTIDGNEYSDTKVVTIPALGHDYAFDGFVWTADYACVARFVCTRDGAETEQACDVTAQTEPATCTEDGLTVYTATCEFEGKQYADRKEVVLPALGHSYGEPTFDWNDDFSACTATFTCERGDDAQTVQCSIVSERTEPTDTEAGKITYTATCEFDGNTYSDIVEDVIPAIGHTYGDPVFEWASDFSTCTAVFSCINGDDTQSIVCAVSAQTVDATCTEDGSVTYTATAVFNDKTYTDVKEETIPATGHSYGEPEFEWADDYSSCSAIFKCTEGDDTQTINCTIDIVTVPASCETNGMITYLATANFDGEKYSDVKTETIPATGHSYGEPEFIWSEDYSSCEAVFTCEYGDDTLTLDCNISENDSTYIASVELNGQTYTSIKEKPTAFAIYSADDNSLTFYSDESVNVPERGDTYNNKTVTYIYTGFENSIWTSVANSPWNNRRNDIKLAEFDSSFKRIKPVSLAYWFYSFTALTNVLNASNLDTSNVTTMEMTFWGDSLLESIDVANWDTSNVTTMYYLFSGCTALKDIDVSNWNVSKVEDMSNVFNNTRALTNLNLSNWNISSATDLSYMFYYCNGVSSLDLSSFDTSNVTSMYRMFYSCSSLVTVYVKNGQFNTDKVTDGNEMFRDCSSIVGGNGTVYSSSNYSYTMAHIDTADNPGYFTDVADKP